MEGLITRYRPTSLDEVIGQPEVIKSLKQILKKGTSNSFLFIGPSGMGKTTLARIMAAKLGAINVGDLTEIDSGQLTGIEDMRQLVQTLKYKPIGNSTTKAIILNEAHRLTVAAQDSLLMSLEEPLDHVYWFLTTTEGARIRPAIKTRCATYELKMVSNNLLFDLLGYIRELESFSASDTVLELCVKEANGSPRQAIANLAVCSNITDRQDAAKLLRTAASEDREAIELCRMLLRGGAWNQLQPILLGLQEQNAESIRHVVRSYMTKVVLDTSKENERIRALQILDHFMATFDNYNGISPVVIAVGRIVYGER
jgi:DNA polymerase III gamma/tau subunit